MVDHDFFADLFHQFRTLGVDRVVGVHNDQQGIFLRPGQGRFRSDNVEGAVVLDVFVQTHEGFPHIVHDDVHRFVEFLCKGEHTHSRPEGVHVRIAVAHDQHVGGFLQDPDQGVGHDPGLALVALFHRLQTAAEVGYVVAALHHSLVAAPPQGQFDLSRTSSNTVNLPSMLLRRCLSSMTT